MSVSFSVKSAFFKALTVLRLRPQAYLEVSNQFASSPMVIQYFRVQSLAQTFLHPRLKISNPERRTISVESGAQTSMFWYWIPVVLLVTWFCGPMWGDSLWIYAQPGLLSLKPINSKLLIPPNIEDHYGNETNLMQLL